MIYLQIITSGSTLPSSRRALNGWTCTTTGSNGSATITGSQIIQLLLLVWIGEYCFKFAANPTCSQLLLITIIPVAPGSRLATVCTHLMRASTTSRSWSPAACSPTSPTSTSTTTASPTSLRRASSGWTDCDWLISRATLSPALPCPRCPRLMGRGSCWQTTHGPATALSHG